MRVVRLHIIHLANITVEKSLSGDRTQFQLLCEFDNQRLVIRFEGF